eukprot:g20683.t1
MPTPSRPEPRGVERLGSHHAWRLSEAVSWFPDAYWIQQVEATALTEAQDRSMSTLSTWLSTVCCNYSYGMRTEGV